MIVDDAEAAELVGGYIKEVCKACSASLVGRNARKAMI